MWTRRTAQRGARGRPEKLASPHTLQRSSNHLNECYCRKAGRAWRSQKMVRAELCGSTTGAPGLSANSADRVMHGSKWWC